MITTAKATSTLPAISSGPQPVANAAQAAGSNDMVLVNSADFDDYMSLLIFLKEPKDKPIVSKLNPKMCLTCWQIFSDREKLEHQQSGGPGPNAIKHKITGTFQSMVQAKKDSILGLSRQWKKTLGQAGALDEKVQKLALSKSLCESLDLAFFDPKAVVQPVNSSSAAKDDTPAAQTISKRKRPPLSEVEMPDQNQTIAVTATVQQQLQKAGPSIQSKEPEKQPAVLQQIITTAPKTTTITTTTTTSDPVPTSVAALKPHQYIAPTRQTRRSAKQLQKGQAQIDKVLAKENNVEKSGVQKNSEKQILTEKHVLPKKAHTESQQQLQKQPEEVQAQAGGLVDVAQEAAAAEVAPQQQNADKLGDILERDAMQFQKQMGEKTLPSTVLLRPLDAAGPHPSTTKFQEKVIEMLQGIEKRIFGIEEQLNQKHFMISSNGACGSTMTNELQQEESQYQQQEMIHPISQEEPAAEPVLQQQNEPIVAKEAAPLQSAEEATADANQKETAENAQENQDTVSEKSDDDAGEDPNPMAVNIQTAQVYPLIPELTQNTTVAHKPDDEEDHQMPSLSQNVALPPPVDDKPIQQVQHQPLAELEAVDVQTDLYFNSAKMPTAEPSPSKEKNYEPNFFTKSDEINSSVAAATPSYLAQFKTRTSTPAQNTLPSRPREIIMIELD